jgi:hypothetical protein
MRLLKLIVPFVLMTVGLTNRAIAWDSTGHMQVADIAWTKLNDKAKKEIATILMAGDPKFRPASASEADVRDAFRKSATFPDVIKFTRTTSYEDIIDTMNKTFFVAKPPDPKDNEDVFCKTWHYYDLPVRDTGNHPAKESNALKALTMARTELAALETASNPDRKMQCWWLDWVEHITGDLHQPLHCASNYESSPDGDAGGNTFMIKMPGTDRPGRLHGYWDGAIGRAIAADKDQGLPPAVEEVSQRWVKDFAPAPADAANLDVMSWIKTGAALADTMVYTGIEKNQAPTKGYDQNTLALCKRQVVLGGVRLAAILNDTLGK